MDKHASERRAEIGNKAANLEVLTELCAVPGQDPDSKFYSTD